MTETIKIGGELENMATGNVVAAASAIKDKVKNKYQDEINAETDASLADRYTKAETYNKTELNNMITTPEQGFVTVTATDETTDVTDVLPATGEADTIYRVGNWDGTQYNDSVFSEYAWNGSAYVKLSTKSRVGEVYDISANHADTKYADLAAALGNNGANVPVGVRKGGMSVKFVQTSDNKYVQFRYMSSSTAVADFTNVANWEGVDDEPTAGSKNLVESGGVELVLNGEVIRDTNISARETLLTDYEISDGGIFSRTNYRITALNRLAEQQEGNIYILSGTNGQLRPYVIAVFESLNVTSESQPLAIIKAGNDGDPDTYSELEDIVVTMPCNGYLVVSCHKSYSNLWNIYNTEVVGGKQDRLTFDNRPIQNSKNPVTSEGIYNEIIRIDNSLEALKEVNVSIIPNSYIKKNGSVITYADFSTSDYIPYNDGGISYKSVFCNENYVAGLYFYDINKNPISECLSIGYGSQQSGYVEESDIPNTTKFIRFSIESQYVDNFYVGFDSVFNIVKTVIDDSVPKYNLKKSAETINTNGTLSLDNCPSIKSNYKIDFYAKITQMGTIRLWHGTGSNSCGMIEVDGTNLTVYRKYGEVQETVPHNLTLQDCINITIIVKDTPKLAYIIVTTNGGIFSKNIYWNGCNPECSVYLTGTSAQLDKCELTLSPIIKDIWVFGDSYTDYWPNHYVNTFGGKIDFMIDGLSGRNSVNSFISLQNELMLSKPKVIVWMLGMNDTDTSTEVNPDWKTVIDNVIDMCYNNGIRFIGYTVPNTPTVINKWKNDYLKSLNVEYIDMAKILGAEDIGSTWYPGLLGDDNTHPSSDGAKLIASIMIGVLNV